jgi:folate-binding protein YgfZ
MPNESKPFFVKLPKRSLIYIEGDDRYVFLQNLITNDINTLEKNPVLYSCLLTPQGKFLFDFFIIKADKYLIIDCEGEERGKELYSRLNLYRLRSKVTLSLEENANIYAGTLPLPPKGSLKDPRNPQIGWRSFEKPEEAESPFDVWDRYRIRLGIPDGSRDMIPDKSTLLECNIDKLNGVSFEKGCYVGQEVTARMKYRGLTKKHLYAVEFSPPYLEAFSDIHLNEKKIGQVHSANKELGLALLKDEYINNNELPFKIL